MSEGRGAHKESGMKANALVLNFALSIDSKYGRALSGEEKAELADRMLELVESPDAPKLVLANGDEASVKELISHSISMGDKRVSYLVKPKGWVFESLAAKEIEHVGGAVAFMRMRGGPLTGLALGAASALGMLGEEKTQSMGERAARERGTELAKAYMNGLAAFFQQRFRPYRPDEAPELAGEEKADGVSAKEVEAESEPASEPTAGSSGPGRRGPG